MIENNLRRIAAKRKSGSEQFHGDGVSRDFDLLSFWQWSTSDLVSNATRGKLAEYIVARALGLGTSGVRDEWAVYDLETPEGIKVEVKSAAYLQSWHQRQFSPIVFRTPATRAWDAETSILDVEAKRQADVYVFAVLTTQCKDTIDPMDLDQWRFFVVPTTALNSRTRSQHSITLKSLQELAGDWVELDDLAERVRKAWASNQESLGT